MTWWNDYLGIPFKEKGRDRSGADCWGLAKIIYQDRKSVILPGFEECYETTNDRDLLAQTIESQRNSKWISPETPQELDIIILNMRGVPMHVGIVTKPGYMIHCAKGINTVHVPYNSMQWQNKVVGFSRWHN